MADILHQFTINGSAQKVFVAFCTSKGLDDWWPLKSSGEPKKGELYTFYFGPEYDWRARVAEVTQGKSITWKMENASEEWIGTEVGATFAERNGVTTVGFFHKGWREASEHYRITNFCWGTLLNGLKMLVEKGTIVPFGERN